MPPSPLLLQKIYHAPLQARLDFCQSLQAELGPQLMGDRAFADAFAELRLAAGNLAGRMATLDMGRLCAACSAANPGGCCSREMADEADALQLLMNLLAGVEVPLAEDGADNDRQCRFLGRQGCIFVFKPMFCLNYNCAKIIAGIGSARAELEVLTGRLLAEQYDVEKMLLARISRTE